MLISISLLGKSLKNWKKHKAIKEKFDKEKHKNLVENFEVTENDSQHFLAGIDSGASFFFLLITIIIFIIEIIILIYLLSAAIVCTSPGVERSLHIILIIFFTYPYALLTIFFGNECTMKLIRSNRLFPSQSTETISNTKSETKTTEKSTINTF